MGQLILHQRTDGGVSVTEMHRSLTSEQIGEVIKTLQAYDTNIIKSVPALQQDLPAPLDDIFRNAWTYDGSRVSVDIDKAKDIKLSEFRALRLPKLQALDVAYQRADESGDAQAQIQIVVEKQVLRDITSIKLPDDISSLRTFIPDELN